MKHVAIAITLAALAPLPAVADEPITPVCGRPAVLEQLAFELRRAGRPLFVEGLSVGEVSTGSLTASSVTHCALRTHVYAFDTNRYGSRPLDEAGIVHYALERRRNGIFLRLE